MKLKFREKVVIVIILCALVVYFTFVHIVLPGNKEANKLKEKKEKVAALLSDIEPLLEKTEEKKIEREQASKKYEIIKFEEACKTATAEEFLVYLGKSAETNGVEVTGFSDLGSDFKDEIYRSYYDIEMTGTPANLSLVIKDLDVMGICYSVGSVSFRQDKEYDYLKRFFDVLTNLSWYTEPEEEKRPEETPENIPPKQENAVQTPTEAPDLKPISPPQTENIQQESDADKPIHKNEIVQGETIETEDNIGIVEPEENEDIKEPGENRIEDRLNEILKLNTLNKGCKIIPLTKMAEITDNMYSNEMRMSFTICLTMFNEPTSETSFITIEKVEEEPEEDNEVF